MKRIVVRSIIAFTANLALISSAIADAPATPQNVQGAWIWEWEFDPPYDSTNYARVSWDLSPGASGYNVFRYNSTNDQWDLIAPSVSGSFFRDYEAGASPAYYTVSAAGPDGESAASSSVAAQMDDPGGYLVNYPGIWPGTLSTTNATISWTTPLMTGVDGMLEFGTSPTNLSLILFDTAYLCCHGYYLTNLMPNTLYYYRISSVGINRAGMAELRSFMTLDTNHPPVAADVTIGPVVDGPADVTLSCTDDDMFDQLTYRVVTMPTNGTLSATVISAYSRQVDIFYTPNPGVRGEDHFQYVVNDGQLDSAPATVTITNIFLNRSPVVTSIVTNTPEDTSLSLVLTATDPDGDPVSIVVTGAQYGTVSFDGTNLVYTPYPDYNFDDVIYFYAIDPYSGFDPGTIEISVLPVDDAPVAYPVDIPTYEDSSLSLLFLWGTDLEGDPLTFHVIDGPSHGTVTGTWPDMIYTPATNYFGLDSFTFVADDGQKISAPATATITVWPVDDAPVPTPFSVTLPEDTSTNIVLSGTDLEGDPLTFSLGDLPAHGTLSGNELDLVYTPDANYFGDDSFTYWASDGMRGSEQPATVSITITPVSDAPVALPASVILAEGTSTNLVLGATNPDGDPLTFTVTINPSHGTLSGTPPNVTYTPDANYFGSDSFAFIVSYGQTNSAAAIVSITVTPVNDAPVAIPGSVTLAEDTSASIVLSGTDIEGDALTFSVSSGPSHGTLSGTAPNLVYTPAANYFGNDSFTFVAHDGQADSAPATATITVTSVNDAPVATPASVTLAEDTSANIALSGTDVEGDALTFTVTVNPAHGSLSGTAPNLTYAPAADYFGSDSFTFVANDGQADSAPVTVTITVTSVNDAPVATPASVTPAEDTSANIVLTGSDVEGAALTFTITSNPAHGTLSGTAPNLIYTPAANYFGSDSFTFTANDGQATSGPATVTITVTPVNDAPVAQAQSVSTPYNTPIAITLTGTDIEGSALSYGVLTQPANGTLSGTAPNLTFTPIGFSGATSFTFKVNDGSLDSASATVTITVQAATSIPAAPNALTATAVSSSQINLAWNDNSNNEDDFKIERSGNGSSWTQIATVGPNVRAYSSTGLVATKTYSYRVRAYNILGNSAYSNTASAKTPH